MHIPDPRDPDPDNPFNPTPRTEGPTNATPFTNRTFMGGDNQVVNGMVPAGPLPRAGAWLIDVLLVGVVIATVISRLPVGTDVGSPVANAIIAAVLWLYLSLLQVTGARTVGKRLAGIRVVRSDGSDVGVGHTLLRNAWVLFTAIPHLGWVTTILGLVILASLFAAPQLQGLHDRVAGTAVIRR